MAAWGDSCYGPRLVRTHSTSDAARLAAVFAGFLLVASVSVGLAAGAPAAPRTDPLQARIDAATLELYALETKLERARQAAATLAARRAALAAERASARKRLAIARDALHRSQAHLAQVVRALYEQTGNADPLAIILGAGSLEEAIAGLDSLSRAAGENNRVLVQARAARQRLAGLDARLARKEAALRELTAATDARAQELERAASARQSYLAGLRRQQGLNARRIAAIQARASAATARTQTLAAAPSVSGQTGQVETPAEMAPLPEQEAAASEPEAAPAAAPGTRTLTVSATGYALRGRTATGVYTAPGVVAVDPSVIPLGTRMTIPGYGSGVAADTGGAVQGNIIDLWFPTVEQALQWGRRTVTITIHQ